jgi:hypothetical protein
MHAGAIQGAAGGDRSQAGTYTGAVGTGRADRPRSPATSRGDAGVSVVREALRHLGVRSDPWGDLAESIAARNQQPADDAARQHAGMAEASRELADAKAAAAERDSLNTLPHRSAAKTIISRAVVVKKPHD